MTDYTKGEWRIHEQAGWEQDDDILIESVQVNPAPNVQKRTTPIATITIFDAEANAHLIAAAPKLYEALIWVSEWLGIREPDGEKPNRADLVRIVKQALALVDK